jgi:hypothetical protein
MGSLDLLSLVGQTLRQPTLAKSRRAGGVSVERTVEMRLAEDSAERAAQIGSQTP